MFRKVVPALAVLAALWGNEAQAQAWSFEQLVKVASASYPSVLAKESEREAATAEVKNAEWQRFPVPSLESALDRQGNSNFVLRLQQVLWAGGAISNNIAAARSLRDASDKAVRQAQYDVVARVIDAYVESVRQQARKAISQQNLKQHELLDDTIKRRVASEISPEVDHKLSRARLSQAINDLSTINQALERSLNALSQLCGKDVTEAAPVDLTALALPKQREEALRQAVAASPGLSRLAFEEAAAEAQVKVSKSVLWPTLALRYEKSFNSNANLYGTSDHRVMAVVEARPGAGLSAFSGVESAVARKNAARLEREVALRDLKLLVTDAWNDRETARGLLEYASSARVSAQDVAESYKRQYIIGRKSWLDVLNAVREATQSEFILADASAQFTAATLRIALLTEKLKLEDKSHAFDSDTRH